MSKTIPKFYRNFALIFVGASIILLFAFIYNMLSRAVITVTSADQDINVSMIVDIKELPFESPLVEDESIPGKIFELELEETKRYESSGAKDIVSDVVGKVTIINDSSKEQTLIETTRLLSPEGALFRMKETMVIKPLERVEVAVYPDKPQEFEGLPPTKFTIPGLWEPLQKSIYAESVTEFTKGGFKVKVVSPEDFDHAERDITKILEQRALDEFEKILSDDEALYTRLVQKEKMRRSADAQAGDERDSFQTTLGMRVAVVAFDELKLFNMVKRKLLQNLSAGKTLKNFDVRNLVYVVEKYDLENKIAHVKVTGSGSVGIKVDHEILDKTFLTGLSENEAREWLVKHPEIKDVRIKFFPSWVSKLPRFAEKIEIIVE